MMAYRIKNWDKDYEKAQTRKVNRAYWVAVPNKHDGRGYRRVARHARNTELFAAWILIVQVASKMPVRGLLVDGDGPLDSQDLADKTGFPSKIFDLAFVVLVEPKIGWLEHASDDELRKWMKEAEDAISAQ